MSGITVGRENSTPIDSKDWGTGQPVVFSHGWALTADAWEDQMRFLASRGYRCIAHDRRGQWPLEPALGGATILLTGEKGQTRLTTRGTDHQPQTSEEIIAEIEWQALPHKI